MKFTLLADIHAIADALTRIADAQRPPEPAPLLPPEEAISYYSEPKASALEEIDRALAAGTLSEDAAAELISALDKEPI